MRLVIVTGMSGAGKTSALKMLEDLGVEALYLAPFAAVKDLPPEAFVERFIAYDREVRSHGRHDGA